MNVVGRAAGSLLTIAMPLALGAYLVRRFRTGWRLFLIGAVTFIGSQVFHIPFNSYVLNPILAALGFGPGTTSGPTLAVAAVLLGLSAGVFEEGARWLVYRFWIRRARTWPQGVTFGSGHGGAEAIIVGVLTLATFVQLTALRGRDLAGIVPPERLAAAQAQVEAYWGAPAWVGLVPAVERASALAVQMTLAVIVLQAFLRPHGGLWLLAAIGWHAAVDAVAVYAGVALQVSQGSISGMLITEAIIAAMAAVSLWFLFRLRPPVEAEILPPVPPPYSGPLPAPDDSLAGLDSSRYSS